MLGYPDKEGEIACRYYEDGGATFFLLDEHRTIKSITTVNAGRDIAAGRRILGKQQRVVDPGRLTDHAWPLKTLLA